MVVNRAAKTLLRKVCNLTDQMTRTELLLKLACWSWSQIKRSRVRNDAEDAQHDSGLRLPPSGNAPTRSRPQATSGEEHHLIKQIGALRR